MKKMIIALYKIVILCDCEWSAEKKEGRYKHTVDLPKTSFGMRANALVREPEIQKSWDDHQVFMRVADKNDGVSIIAIIVLLFSVYELIS